MIETVCLDLAALLLAPELKARLLLSQLELDGVTLFCFADIPRKHMKVALQKTEYLRYFDRLIYSELFPELQPSELRQLASAYWLRFPEEIDYLALLPLLPGRKRMPSNALRAAQSLASGCKLPVGESPPPKDPNG